MTNLDTWLVVRVGVAPRARHVADPRHPKWPTCRGMLRWAARCAVELGARPLAGLQGAHHQLQLDNGLISALRGAIGHVRSTMHRPF